MSEPAGDNAAMDMDEIQNPMYKSAREESNAEAIARIEATMATMMSFMQSMATSQNPLGNSEHLQESFADGRTMAPTFVPTPPRVKDRRSSMLLKEVASGSTMSSLTTVAVPKVFQTKTLQKGIDFMALRQFQQDFAVYRSDPSSHGQETLLWNDHYISQTTRARAYRRLEQFNNIYENDTLLQKCFPDWSLPLEAELPMRGQESIIALLEISIVPHSPYEYEEALRDICRSEIDMGKISLSPAGCPYYLGKIKRVIDLLRLYNKLVPESCKDGDKQKRMYYNLGVKKMPSHGTKGTIPLINESLMPTELQHALANLHPLQTNATNMIEHLDYLENAIAFLMKTYDKLKMWLQACQSLENNKRKSSQDKPVRTEKHRSSRAEEVLNDDVKEEAVVTDMQATLDDDSTTIDLHDSAAMDAVERSKTPCYAFLQGNCTSGRECARSHDKKELEQFLQEQLTTVRKM